MLEAEGLLIDPVGAIVAGVTLQLVVLDPSLDALASAAGALVARTGFGATAGVLCGLLLVGLLRFRRAVPEGVVVGNLEPRVARELGEFQEHLTVGLIGMLFVLLAADVRVAEVWALGLPGLLTVGTLALVVRPLGVALCTAGSELRFRERAFLSWVAPRGVVAAAIASLTVAFLHGEGIAQAEQVRALVFLTIALTVVVQGGSAPWVARLLRVRAPGRERVVILGAEELGFALAEALALPKEKLLFCDANPLHCREAEARGYRVVYGDVLQERTLARMRLERARAVVGLTANNEVNHHFAGEARDEFEVPECFVAIGGARTDVASRIVHKQESRVLFDGPKEVERWNVRLRHRLVVRHELVFEGAPAAETKASEGPSPEPDPYLLLVMIRDDERSIMYERLELAAGDRTLALVHDAEEDLALERLARLGWHPATADDEE